jgi:DNA-binding Lrp family transcriptional regulator
MNVVVPARAPAPALDATDRRLIRAAQAGLPLCRDPYRALADRLGLSADDVMARLARMLARGVVRRIGAVPNHYKLGVTANGMTVWDVDDAAIERLGPEVGALPFVTHCYRRPRHAPLWPYNLFAMVHGRNRDQVAEKVATIAGVLGPAARAHDVLYSTRILKKTGLRLAD